jgi:hypothetical protein
VDSIAPRPVPGRTFRPYQTTRAGLNQVERWELEADLRAYFRWHESGVDPEYAPEFGPHCEEARAEHERFLAAIHRFMQQLSPDLRDLARMKVVEKLSDREVAARFGVGSPDIYKKMWQLWAPRIYVAVMATDRPEGWPDGAEHEVDG